MAVTLHIEQEGGTLPQPVLLDESRTVTVDHRFTTARQGLWMLLAQSADGYTAMSCPAKYDCYDTIGLSGTVEDIDPSVYAQFVALVQQAVNTAMNEGAAAKDAAKTAKAAADAAQKRRSCHPEGADGCRGRRKRCCPCGGKDAGRHHSCGSECCQRTGRGK